MSSSDESELERAILAGVFFLTALSSTVLVCLMLFILVSFPNIITDSEYNFLIMTFMLVCLFAGSSGCYLFVNRERLSLHSSILAISTICLLNIGLLTADYIRQEMSIFTTMYVFLGALAIYFLVKRMKMMTRAIATTTD